MTPEQKVEHALILHFRPTFLCVEPQNENGDIHIVMSSIRFNYLNIQERIIDIYNLLNFKIPDILQQHLVVIEAYNSEEMNALLEEAFKNDK